jgi:hypothetical protein
MLSNNCGVSGGFGTVICLFAVSLSIKLTGVNNRLKLMPLGIFTTQNSSTLSRDIGVNI